jgi:hypothetical protein
MHTATSRVENSAPLAKFGRGSQMKFLFYIRGLGPIL